MWKVIGVLAGYYLIRGPTKRLVLPIRGATEAARMMGRKRSFFRYYSALVSAMFRNCGTLMLDGIS